MSKQAIVKSFTKMSSESLLRKISKGEMNKKEATIAAFIIEKRFPSPKG